MEFPVNFIAIFVFAIGACVGSFLNVVVYRMPLNLSLVTPPSACPNCGHKLAAYDNVPIFGWLWLRGKCRYCGNPISPRNRVELRSISLREGRSLRRRRELCSRPRPFGSGSIHGWPSGSKAMAIPPIRAIMRWRSARSAPRKRAII